MSTTSPLVPHASRPVVSTGAACNLLSIGKTKLYEHLALGDLKSVKRGSRRYIFTDSVLALVATWRDQNVETGHEVQPNRAYGQCTSHDAQGGALQAGRRDHAN